MRPLAVAALVALLAGCASGPATLKADVVTAAGLNPDSKGRASPVTVRLYELKARSGFDSADFFSLWDREREVLGADFLVRDEVQLRPGDKPKLERKLQPDTQFVAVVAAFRDLERSQWRSIVSVGQTKSTWNSVKSVVQDPVTSVTIKLEAKSISITKNQ